MLSWALAPHKRSWRCNRVQHGAHVWWCNRVQQGATGCSYVCSCVRSADTHPRAVQGGQGGAGKGTHDTRRVDISQRVLRPPPQSLCPAALLSPSAPPPVAQQEKRMPACPLLRAQCLAHWHYLAGLGLEGSRDLEHASCAQGTDCNTPSLLIRSHEQRSFLTLNRQLGHEAFTHTHTSNAFLALAHRQRASEPLGRSYKPRG